MNRPARVALLLSALAITACDTVTVQRYPISPDNMLAIRELNTSGVSFSPFEGKAFDAKCRGGPEINPPDGLSHAEYIRKAFEDEFKIAGAAASTASSTSRVTILGQISKIDFSSSRGVTGGSWTIQMTLRSSNGAEMRVEEYYEFEASFSGIEACRNVAGAFPRAVQNLVGKTVKSPAFRRLIQ